MKVQSLSLWSACLAEPGEVFIISYIGLPSPEHLGNEVYDEHKDGNNNDSRPKTEFQHITHKIATAQCQGKKHKNKAVEPFQVKVFGCGLQCMILE
ncbi:rubredoxin [Pontibacter aydingkolensis]|uniref:Uncharacterized protein n=1 Tax=Pontibacter aydingkolensis TaxID=1911536 RepID=A0ABS7CZQ4_9BACT|nr:hypothetical protein [Pontibacter aydingkolensis]MBW7469338.1 hypothetical protein [Pontibacter aydingkolensis]